MANFIGPPCKSCQAPTYQPFIGPQVCEGISCQFRDPKLVPPAVVAEAKDDDMWKISVGPTGATWKISYTNGPITLGPTWPLTFDATGLGFHGGIDGATRLSFKNGGKPSMVCLANPIGLARIAAGGLILDVDPNRCPKGDFICDQQGVLVEIRNLAPFVQPANLIPITGAGPMFVPVTMPNGQPGYRANVPSKFYPGQPVTYVTGVDHATGTITLDDATSYARAICELPDSSALYSTMKAEIDSHIANLHAYAWNAAGIGGSGGLSTAGKLDFLQELTDYGVVDEADDEDDVCEACGCDCGVA